MGYQRLNILVVDDQTGVRYLLDAIIREEGHNPYLAANGLEAVEMVETVNPHLIFMDVKMPLMDGTKALEKIKELGYQPEVVIMTAFAEADVINKAHKNGVIRCLIKPFEVDDIREVVREVARKKYPQASAL